MKKVIVIKRKQDHYSKQARSNKFYVGSPKALNGWGHTTLEAAVKHAEALVAEDENAHFVVQIVRIVRPRPIETTVEVV